MIDAANLPNLIASRYRPIRLIASGGMGSVYEVEHALTAQRLALKILWSSANANVLPEAQARFKREVRASGRIRSDNVVQVIDADFAAELGGAPFLVMELLEGTDLERAVAAGPADAVTVVGWLRQVAPALDKAHGLGMVHRDLKPENLFLSTRADGRAIVKILDFGIVKMIDDGTGATGSDQIVGTPRYMAPEQASARAPVTPATDRYALGLVAYRLLVGASYHQGGVMMILTELLHGELRPPSVCGSRLGPAFDAWFLKACHRDPGQRFGSTSEQIEALAAALGVPGAPVEAPVDTMPAPARRGSGGGRRRREMLAGASLAVLVGAIAIVYGGFRRSNEQRMVCGLRTQGVSRACAVCVARECCQQAEACGDTATCSAVEQCVRACASGDAPCRAGCYARGAGAGRVQQEALEACRAASCAPACLPPPWSCVGRVAWSSPTPFPSRINVHTTTMCAHCGIGGFPIAGGPGGSPVAGVIVRVCSLADPKCVRPIARRETDDSGAATLGIDTSSYPPPLAVFFEFRKGGYEDVLVQLGHPVSGDVDLGRIILVDMKAEQEPTAANLGTIYDPTRATVDAYISDCNGRPAAKEVSLSWLDRDGVTVTRDHFPYTGAAIAVNLPVNDAGVTRVVGRDPRTNRPIFTVHAVVRAGANTELRLAPAP